MSDEREPGARSPRLSAVFGNPEFRALWSAEAVSVLGDQLARVAFSVLVFQRTDSAALSALVYALTFLPALLGGALLGWVADRYPRRRVMIVSDLGRMLLALPMVWPGLPLPVLCGLIVATVLLGSPHTAAQGALLPEVLRGTLLERGYAVRQITGQTAQVAGFATGGAVLVVLSPSATLAINAATFGLSALLVRLGVGARPAPARGGPAGTGTPRRWTGDVAEGARTVFGDPQLRTLALVVWLAGCFIAPEGLAVAYAAELGAGPLAVGLLMAAIPAGSVVGALVFTRWVRPEVRERTTLPLAIAAGLPLTVSPLVPSVGVAIVLWSVTGACVAAALVQAQASFVRRTPPGARGRATGLAAAGLIGAQGLALLAGGLIAQRWSPAAGVATVGITAVLLLAGLLVTPPARALGRSA
ncbi:transmembrane secretion effector [Pseudonocardia sediminis]|uniref:Transmembrane secretion effector n=1 Tax=Pseudonocardia sediminis TaxID=1397368 RepID=A0A4Q7UTS1_PSEST|nr:MFS transporter [Pseudonocardia sediminis]RZT84414.1 transmembrane secretion effector [Pseudonocardia sediminis]